MSTPTIQPGFSSLIIGPREGRTHAPLNVVGEEVLVKVGGTDTKGRFAFFHATAPPMSGPPLHLHTREDELFYVLEGELVFQIADKRTLAKVGTTVYVSRESVHTYQNFTEHSARLLIMVTPAGVDRLFEEMSAGAHGMSMPDPVLLESLFTKYGVRMMGPPLS
jgi:mannose-6-phosphate isomerase-like protein (cupin superfamily)